MENQNTDAGTKGIKIPFNVPDEAREILEAAPSVIIASSVEDLTELAVNNAGPDG